MLKLNRTNKFDGTGRFNQLNRKSVGHPFRMTFVTTLQINRMKNRWTGMELRKSDKTVGSSGFGDQLCSSWIQWFWWPLTAFNLRRYRDRGEQVERGQLEGINLQRWGQERTNYRDRGWRTMSDRNWGWRTMTDKDRGDGEVAERSVSRGLGGVDGGFEEYWIVNRK